MEVKVSVPGLPGGKTETVQTRWDLYVPAVFGLRRLTINALVLVCEDGERWCTASVNPPEWPEGVDREDHIAIKNWSEGEGMPAALIAAGIIEPAVVATVPSGFVTVPIYKLTITAMQERDKQFDEAEGEDLEEEYEDDDGDYIEDDE